MSARPLRVWLVDDDASIRWVLERALKQAGMSPIAFEDADSAMAALRRGELAQRLLGSLQVDTAATQRVLQWQPVLTVDEALRQLSRTEVA